MLDGLSVADQTMVVAAVSFDSEETTLTTIAKSIAFDRFHFKYAVLNAETNLMNEKRTKSKRCTCLISEDIKLRMIYVSQLKINFGKYPINQTQWSAVAEMPPINKRLILRAVILQGRQSTSRTGFLKRRDRVLPVPLVF